MTKPKFIDAEIIYDENVDMAIGILMDIYNRKNIGRRVRADLEEALRLLGVKYIE